MSKIVKFITKQLLIALVVMGTCYLPGISVENFWYALLVAFAVTIVNMFVKPIVKILAFPINFISLGLFNAVINLTMLYAISIIIPQYSLDNFFGAFAASVIIAVFYKIIRRI